MGRKHKFVNKTTLFYDISLTYDGGIYHPPKGNILSKIYHPRPQGTDIIVKGAVKKVP